MSDSMPHTFCITVARLRMWRACDEHVEKFAVAFPEGLTITPEANPDDVEKVVEAGLDVLWVADKLLTSQARAEYDQARAVAFAKRRRTKATALWKLLADPANRRLG
jgi:hypothetical protein